MRLENQSHSLMVRLAVFAGLWNDATWFRQGKQMLVMLIYFGLGIARAPWWSPIPVIAVLALLRAYGPSVQWRETAGLPAHDMNVLIASFWLSVVFAYALLGAGRGLRWLFDRQEKPPPR